jgi:hypothetical protein
MRNFKHLLTAAALALPFAVGAQATDQQIARLGTDLTPFGSPRAGNADGTIPAWTGGITQPPAGYQPGQFHPDPFANDPVLFTISSENVDQYAERLSAGQVAMLRQYPTFRMNVYPSRRSTSAPDWVYEATRRNARTGRLVAGGEGVADVVIGVPFPFPTDPQQIMWNHKLKFRGPEAVRRMWHQAAPTTGGEYTLIRIVEEIMTPYSQPNATFESLNNIHFYYLQEVLSPARLAGSVLLVHETLEQVSQPRSAWTYNPGQRRVRRAPNVAYDNPGTASDGLRTNDQTDMFNGAMDRYEWNIVGQREMYVPYNAYRLHSGNLMVNDIIRPYHLNPDHLRYELQRVWVVEANLRDGFRNIYKRRVFYVEADSWQIVAVDHYDNRDQLWRVSEGHPINYYEVPAMWTTLEVVYDLQSGRYVANGLNNEDSVHDFGFDVTASQFTPAALRARGTR